MVYTNLLKLFIQSLKQQHWARVPGSSVLIFDKRSWPLLRFALALRIEGQIATS